MSWIYDLLPNAALFVSGPGDLFLRHQPLDLLHLRAWAARCMNLDVARLHCPRGDWRLWLERRTAENVEDVRKVVAAAAACARWILPFGLQNDPRPARAVELAERWAADGSGSELLREAAQAADEATMDLDGNIHFSEVLACAAAVAACNLAAIPLPDDPRLLVLMIDNCYPVSAYAWAKAHAAADPFCGKIPSDEHRQLYAQTEAAARKEARVALDLIIAQYYP